MVLLRGTALRRPDGSFLRVVAEAVAPLADLVLPTRCAGCAAGEEPLCAGCRAPLEHPARAPALSAAQRALLDGLQLRTCARYEGSTARLIHNWKDGDRHDLTPVLGAVLARAVRALPVPAGVLVPVPSSGAARRRRGEDVVAELARRAAAQLTAPGQRSGPWRVAPLLRQNRRVADQATLGARQRAVNVRGAFSVRAGRTGDRSTPCVVVDDVLTTGASAAEAVRALRSNGWWVPAVATVCVTPRRRDPPSVGCRGTGDLH